MIWRIEARENTDATISILTAEGSQEATRVSANMAIFRMPQESLNLYWAGEYENLRD
jgi:hypothetical protein